MESITLGDISIAIGFLVALISGIEFLAMRMRKYMKSTIQTEIAPFCNNMQEQIKIVQEDNKLLHEELKQNSLNTMKNTICNKDIPLSERISVGKDYIEKGGNGAVKVLVHTLEEKYENNIKKGV